MPLEKTYNDMEFLSFEATVVFNEEMNVVIEPIDDVYVPLHAGINWYIDFINPKKEHTGDFDALTKVFLKLDSTVYAECGDEIQNKVDAAVKGIGKFFKLYIQG